MAPYRCSKCGAVFELTYIPADCKSPCCCDDSVVLVAQTGNPDENKHIPYIERVDGGVLVKVGKREPHPMTEDHYIVYIEIFADGIIMRKYLKPGDKPEAFFKTDAEHVASRELCNKHGLFTYE